jgi:hypothetical protein
MPRWNRTSKTMAAVVAFAGYFALAGWSKLTWVDPVPKGRAVVLLERPFEPFGQFGAASYQLKSMDIFKSVGDSDDGRDSPVLLYENNKLLGPPHSGGEDISRIGHGRYSHAKTGLLFSASDNSDINENKRDYWAVLP